jgi:preprotein translocase subunit SecE
LAIAGIGVSEILNVLFSTKLYKATQGRTARRLTMWAVTLMVLFACVRFCSMPFLGWGVLSEPFYRGLVAIAIGFIGFWFSFRLVHLPLFADFLVSVEGEMLKVYWPSKPELTSSTKVVLAFFVMLSVTIFAFDIFWQVVFKWIHVLPW